MSKGQLDSKIYPSRRSSMERNDADQKIEKVKSEILSKMEQLLDEGLNRLAIDIYKRMDEIEQKVSNTFKLAQNNEKKLLSIEKKVNELSVENAKLKTIVEEQKKETDEMEENLKDRTNRQMRKTLVFKNVKEDAKESWAETTNKLARTISEVSKGQLHYETALNYIERAHRGKGKKNRPRPIFA